MSKAKSKHRGSSGLNLNDLMQFAMMAARGTPLGIEVGARGTKFRDEANVVRLHLNAAAHEIGALPPDKELGIGGALKAILAHWQGVWTSSDAGDDDREQGGGRGD